MFEIGNYVIYSSAGVCKVQGFTTPADCPTLKGMEATRKYYVLEPVYGQGTIYTPTDNTKVFMRAIITPDEVNRLIDSMPNVDAQEFRSTKTQEIKAHYQELTDSHTCDSLIELSMSLYAKKKNAEEQNRKFGQLDERYMKQTEEVLYGEFAVALGIDKDDVPNYISERLKTKS